MIFMGEKRKKTKNVSGNNDQQFFNNTKYADKYDTHTRKMEISYLSLNFNPLPDQYQK